MPRWPRLVFSTYQTHVVAAGMQPGESFDLAIFDEAHKTAGRKGVQFDFALSNKNFAIRKRLFLTTTPRHYDLRRRDREGDARLVYSMDAPDIYGSVAHQLTFAAAARRGLICHYRVIISVVTSGMVNDHSCGTAKSWCKAMLSRFATSPRGRFSDRTHSP